MSPEIITSSQNPRIRHLRRLRDDQTHQQEFFLLEGRSVIEEALASGWEVQSVYHTPGNELATGAAPCFQVSERLLQSATALEQSPGILAVARKRLIPVQRILFKNFMLLLDRIQDPGNVGTLLRSAAAFGASAVLSIAGTVHFYHPKVVRAAMGAMFRLQLCEDVKPAGLQALLQTERARLLIADSRAGEDPQNLPRNEKVVLALGHETSGVSRELREMSRCAVRIPMGPAAESLNVAVAGSILMYELAKCRRSQVTGTKSQVPGPRSRVKTSA